MLHQSHALRPAVKQVYGVVASAAGKYRKPLTNRGEVSITPEGVTWRGGPQGHSGR